MTKLELIVHVKSHNPRNQLLQTERGGESPKFLKHMGVVGDCRGGGRATSASISCSNI